MNKKKRFFALNALDYRIFITLFELEKEEMFAKPFGLLLIFKGESEFSYLSAFRTLKNISSKKISLRMKILLRRNYLGLKFNPEDNELYYCLTNLGRKAAIEYSANHKNGFKKYDKIIDNGIVKIR